MFLVEAIDCAPAILVGFAAAQEMELASAFADRLGDRMSDQDRTRALLGKFGIEAAEISIGAAAIEESVICSDDNPADLEQVRTRHAMVGQYRQHFTMKSPDG